MFEAVVGSPIGLNQTFFDAGASSLGLMRFHLRCATELGLQFSVADLFEHVTIAELARHLDDQAGAVSRSPAPSAPLDEPIAVIGGTEVFGLFLARYDVFYLSHAPHVRLPGGRPVFPGVPARTPAAMLSSSGLVAGSVQVLDAANEVTVTTWQRVQRATR